MMADALQSALAELTEIQRQAVEWDEGALLVLAGPGSGKTRVLTCRVARLLESSRDQRFRVLALTFTNKAAHEMVRRVEQLVPGLEERTKVDTFHGFCSQVLRQHGVHVGVRPDYAIYSRESDRQAVLEDALRRGRPDFGREDLHLLPMIDELKAQLVGVDQAEQRVANWNGRSQEDARRLAYAYRLYEDELQRTNGLDFNSLILKAHELFSYPAMARHYQTVYRYWHIDEFQDTNGAQYQLLKRMAGDDFRRIFAVADDDQTIYEWNGANVRRIQSFAKHFSCRGLQLPTNFRCPPRIVEAANRLVVYNTRRMENKRPARSGAPNVGGGIEHREHPTDVDEVREIAAEISRLDMNKRGETVVLARNRSLLESMHKALRRAGVVASVLARRDDFVSPQMRWLVACLRQICRPLDRRNIGTVAESFSSFAALPPECSEFDVDEIASCAAADGFSYLSLWVAAAQRAKPSPPVDGAVAAVTALVAGDVPWEQATQEVLHCFQHFEESEDLQEDLSAWRRLSSEIRKARGRISLHEFLQEVELRSKEPAAVPGALSLATIHGAKGLEFDTVYVIGMADEVMPSWHSVKPGASGSTLEEERRGCFVAITRTKRRLILSSAREYKGWAKEPSRFLKEMGVLSDQGGSSEH